MISEKGTNPFGLPGLLEVERFDPDTLLSVASIRECWQIQSEATRYWQEATAELARQLDLPAYRGPSAVQLARCCRDRRAQHRSVVWSRQLHRLGTWLTPPPISCWWRRRQRVVRGLGRLLGAGARHGSGSTHR